MVRSGPMRDRVKVQNFVKTRDASGGIIRTWQTVVTRWGKIDPLQGDEKEFGDTIESRATHKVSLRFYDGLDTNQRLLFGTREFNIVEIIDPGNRHRQTVLKVREDV